MIQDELELPKAIPLWIGGHAFLTVTRDFHNVMNARTGEVLRRVPLCGPDEFGAALAVALAALGSWAGLSEERRIYLLAALGGAAAKYSGHLAGLLSEELGIAPDDAAGEVERSVALLCNASSHHHDGVVAIAGSRELGLLGSLQILIPLLAGGATAVIFPSTDAPSALLALAELTARCGFPDGVLNIVFADPVLFEQIRRDPGILCLP